MCRRRLPVNVSGIYASWIWIGAHDWNPYTASMIGNDYSRIFSRSIAELLKMFRESGASLWLPAIRQIVPAVAGTLLVRMLKTPLL